MSVSEYSATPVVSTKLYKIESCEPGTTSEVGKTSDLHPTPETSVAPGGHDTTSSDDCIVSGAAQGPGVSVHPDPIQQSECRSFDQAMDEAFGPGVNSYQRGEVMLDLLRCIPSGQNQRIRFFKEAWSASDDIYHLRDDLQFRLESLALEGEDFRVVLDADEKQWFDGLGEKFRVYRGCSEERTDGISWTTDLGVARTFAKGHRRIHVPSPVVVSATCYKADVLLAVNDRDEFEIVVDPEQLEEVSVQAPQN